MEDDVNLAENLAEIVHLAGYEALAVHSAEHAFSEVGCGSVDAILTDNGLSGTRGAALLSKLRSQGNTTPAVLITAWLDDDAAAMVRARDALFMAKPIDIPKLLSLLRSLLDGDR